MNKEHEFRHMLDEDERETMKTKARPLSIIEVKKILRKDHIIEHSGGNAGAHSQLRKAGKTFLELYTFVDDNALGEVRLILRYDGKRLKVMNVSKIDADEEGELVDYGGPEVPSDHLTNVTNTWRKGLTDIAPAINELMYQLGLVNDPHSNLIRGRSYGAKIKASSKLEISS